MNINFRNVPNNYVEKIILMETLCLPPYVTYDAQTVRPCWQERADINIEAVLDGDTELDFTVIEESIIAEWEPYRKKPLVGLISEHLTLVDKIRREGLRSLLEEKSSGDGLFVGMISLETVKGCFIIDDAYACPMKSEKCRHTSYIWGIGTLVSGGIGTTLLLKAIDQCRRKGVSRVNLHAFPDSRWAEVYRALKFESMGEISNYWEKSAIDSGPPLEVFCRFLN